MKALYIKPELMVVQLKKLHLLSGSETIPTGKTYDGETPKLGKEGFFGGWDDDVEPGEDY